MKQRNHPAAGEFYRHFKGNLYQIIGVAKHSETGEQMVVYQALYGDYCLYTRPLDMFLSPVDKEKYPESKQEYRFEKYVPGDSEEKKVVSAAQTAPMVTESKMTEDAVEASDDEEKVRPEILRFLDAETASEKLEVLRALRAKMDEQLLTTIELSLDILSDDRDSLERRYDFVERNLEQKIRFEGSRLR